MGDILETSPHQMCCDCLEKIKGESSRANCSHYAQILTGVAELKCYIFMNEMPNRHIVIFDGVCNFCNGTVNFIIKRDPKGVFVFTPMHSQNGQSLIRQYNVSEVGADTIFLIKNGKCYLRSDAALEIAKELSGLWFLISSLKVIPKKLRDYFYILFAGIRYRIFGKRDTCMIPTPDLRNRFINSETQ